MRVRPSDPSLVDDLLVACRRAGIRARRDGNSVVTEPPETVDADAPEQERIELTFFVQAWALHHPNVIVDVDET